MRIIRFFLLALLATVIIAPAPLTLEENIAMRKCIVRHIEKPNARAICYEIVTRSRGLGVRPSLWAKCEHASEAACDADAKCEWHAKGRHASSSFCARK